MGVGCWITGNLVGDRQGGTNIALTLIGIGGGLAKQEGGTAGGSTIKSENIENVDIGKKHDFCPTISKPGHRHGF